MIELPAVIEKNDVAVLGALKGKCNEFPRTIDGKVFSEGRIIFRGFAGALHLSDRMYHGVVRFEPCGFGSAPYVDFSPIVRAMEITESEVDDGLHGDDNREDHDRDDHERDD